MGQTRGREESEGDHASHLVGHDDGRNSVDRRRV